MTKTKTTALATLLTAALALCGCSRNTNQADENSTLIRLRGTEVRFESEPLVVQVSEGSQAYIWQFSDKLALPDYDWFTGKKVPASTLADVQLQATLYKQEQDLQYKSAPVLITGDDRANCGAVFETIANAKRAGITAFYFETDYRGAGRTDSEQIPVEIRMSPPVVPSPKGLSEDSDKTDFQIFVCDGHMEISTPSVNPSSKPITITISKDGKIAWNNMLITSNDNYRLLLSEIKEVIHDGSAHFIVKVDAQTDFNTLRWMLDQILKVNKESITLELRELK